ncbi:hypothetical protein [Nocardiopsis sp. ATB16-24]|uniref:hypothetical protein n=1 Tax=Nocardiopsis sp. ATB16-24 TaxID=3019555 RepID=UPI0025551E9D|nr:hypothetical protein [Nocardiopsis sp. ATB16-24]
MTILHWFLLLPVGWGVLIVCKPQVHWRLRSWRSRGPKTDHPGDTWLLMHRLGAAVTVIVALVLWATLWESAPDGGSSTDLADVSEESSDGPEPRPENHTLTTTWGEAGRISGYTVDAEDRLTVHVSLGSCAFLHLVRAVEGADRVVLAGGASTGESFCEEDPDGSLREVVTLDRPLGDREVVDFDDKVVPLCEERC